MKGGGGDWRPGLPASWWTASGPTSLAGCGPVDARTLSRRARPDMRNVLDWSLVDGVVPAVLTGLGALAGGVLLARRSRAWWVQVVPAVGGGTAVWLLLVWAVDVVWRPFPDSLPWRVVLWGGVAVFAMSLAVSSVR